MRSEHSSEIMAMPLRKAREMFERQYLAAQIMRFGGNISRTAAFIGMERSALHRKLKGLGITSDGQGRADNAAERSVGRGWR
jgi:two-component system nitrogen regulation response regulator NtrX